MRQVAAQDLPTVASDVLKLIDEGQFVRADKVLSQSGPSHDPMMNVLKAEVEIYFARLDQADDLLEAVAPDIESIHLAARYALARGGLLYWRYDYEEASDQLQAAYHMYKFLADSFYMASALYGLGRLRRRQAQYEAAVDLLNRARAMVEAEETTRGDFLRGLIDFNLGVCQHQLGDLKTASALYESSVGLLRDTEEYRYYGLALNSYGALLKRLGKYDAALNCLERATQIFSRLGIFEDMAHTTSNLALTLIRLQRYDEAQRLLYESIELRHRVGDIAGTALCLELLAELNLEVGDLPAAVTFAAQAMEQADLATNSFQQAYARITAGRVCFRKGDAFGAEKRLLAALDMAATLESKELICVASLYLAECYLVLSPLKGREYLWKSAELLHDFQDVWFQSEFERISQRYKGERISITEDNKLLINGNLLPTWAAAKEAVEKFLLKNALEQSEDNQTQAGRLLGITKVHVHDKRKQYDI